MFSTVKIARSTFIVLALGILAQGTGRQPAEAGGTPGPQVLRADQLTRQQFEVLPDTAVIESKGQRMTKAQIQTKAMKSKEAIAKVQASARDAQAKFEKRLAQFLQQRQAKLQADNAKAMAEVARLRQVAAIEEEGAKLWQRAQRAAPAERAQIEQRARQLLQQFQQIGR
jgi:hypothetical protein